MKRLLIAALLAFSPVAYGQTWYTYDGPGSVCHNASRLARSPYNSSIEASPWSFQKWAMTRHSYHGTKTIHGPQGQNGVEISVGAAHFTYWRSRQACVAYAESVRAKAHRELYSCSAPYGQHLMREAVHSIDEQSTGPWMHYVRTLPNFYPSQWPDSLTCLVVVSYGGGPVPIKEVHPVTIRRLSHGRGWVASIP